MRVRTTVSVLLGEIALVALATPAFAGTTPSSGSCGCSAPTTHQVKVPGVTITPPSINIGLPSVGVGSSSASGVATATATAESNVSVTVNSTSSGSTASQTGAALLGSFGGGGSGSWSPESSVSTEITDVKVESPQAPTVQQVCAAWKAAVRQVAIQATCLDDKAVPHPASQLSPDKAVAAGYEGEVFRCIAGARMQYTVADFTGVADFNHGQTIVCNKGEALWHSANGAVACKAQIPQRDCNERSLLRRFGAGIKVMAISGQRICAAYRAQTVAVAPAVQSGPAVLN